MNHILINGVLHPPSEANISVDDRGFRFGDGVFETIPIINGRPYLWDYHIQRMSAGLSLLEIPASQFHLHQDAEQLLAANKTRNGLLRIAVSRGVGSQGYLPTITCTPTIVMQIMPNPIPFSPQGITLFVSSYEKISPRALPTQCKMAQGLNQTLARMEADKHSIEEALQLSSHGLIAEASAANIFWRKNGILFTPNLSTGALAGVTRRRLMELSPYPVSEGCFELDELQQADAVILTNASRGIIAVRALLPHGYEWNSIELASELTLLRNHDILQLTGR